MYTRLLNPVPDHSYFLFGPRGTGKTTWIRSHYPESIYIDLLRTDIYTQLLANPETLESYIPQDFNDFIIIDEIQRIPELLNEVHRLIESPKHYKFILTGSSARKLRRQGVNLLAGRAYTYNIYPLTINELGKDFDLKKVLRFGTLPAIYSKNDPHEYLQSYLSTYLEQEINQEGMTRNLSAFYRFLQIASYSQGSPVNTSSIAREVGIHSKVVDNYFTILIDLLMGSFLPAFTRRAKRRLVSKPKFYLFDSGIYNTARPKGYLDKNSEIDGISLETLFLNHLMAINEYSRLEYTFSYFRTASGLEVDFIAYGPRGFHAFEIKLTKNIYSKHLKGLLAFSRDYPEAKLHLLYTGNIELYFGNITVSPIQNALSNLAKILTQDTVAT
ncbi:TPA: ATPase [Patescibacteria group bacterium]|uniref:ATPase n=1 Tax=Candidatus Amesbacteria bacterium GW2011_GWC2_47_8 TaxID=1618367 RepID=A0A0G1TPX5_9BACT|nr:MAG: hypothetical protein UX42_C0011G0011 [Microgenomates group bacterium GW2011_GWC1_46_20]KKU83876.1 MAG: hypothetical protein UY11_C0012G0011 [Candidatus Amesbacteria bacterium GW2011_GWC2_47_8]HCM37341.1 ATPase [Patescibacteria group bacterium]